MLLKYKKLAILYKGIAKYIIYTDVISVRIVFKCIITLIVFTSLNAFVTAFKVLI